MSAFRFTSNSEAFQAKLNAMGGKLYKAIRDEFVQLENTWKANMKSPEHFSGYYYGKTRGKRLRSRTGHLRSSVGGRVSGSTMDSLRVLLHIGSKVPPSARLQEEGGTITPKKGRYLTIPLRQAMTPSGALRGKAEIKRDGSGYRTGFGPTFILNLGGRPIIMARRPGGDVVPLYTLRRSVKIPPRLGATREFHEVGKKFVPRISERLLRVLVGKGGGA